MRLPTARKKGARCRRPSGSSYRHRPFARLMGPSGKAIRSRHNSSVRGVAPRMSLSSRSDSPWLARRGSFPLLQLAENVRHYVAAVPHDYGHLRRKTGCPSAAVLRSSTCDRVLSRGHGNRVLPVGADGRGKPSASRRNEDVSPTGREDAAAERTGLVYKSSDGQKPAGDRSSRWLRRRAVWRARRMSEPPCKEPDTERQDNRPGPKHPPHALVTSSQMMPPLTLGVTWGARVSVPTGSDFSTVCPTVSDAVQHPVDLRCICNG